MKQGRYHSAFVPGLGPGIHEQPHRSWHLVDGRAKPGHERQEGRGRTGWFKGLS